MENPDINELAKAIPREGWLKLIDTACHSFADIIQPITRTTAGLGGLIQAKFDEMIDVQKVFAAAAVASAREKVERTGRIPSQAPKAKVLLPAIEHASTETDDDLRNLWANLIANEILDSDIHPEFPSILNRLSAGEALVLSEKALEEPTSISEVIAIALKRTVKSIVNLGWDNNEHYFEHLGRLGLLRYTDSQWKMTRFGVAFIRAVSDPSDLET